MKKVISTSKLILYLLSLLFTYIACKKAVLTPPSTGPKLKSASVQTFTVTPAKAYDYVNGVGVNTHLRFTNVYYNSFDAIIFPKLKKLGIKNIRDGVPYRGFLNAATVSTIQNRFIKLYDSCGIKVSYALDSRKVADSVLLRDSASYLSVFSSSVRLRQTIQYLEGFNEPDLTIYTWYPTKWDTLTYKIQKGLWTRAKSMPELSGISVLSTSLVTYYNASRIGQIAAMTPYLSTYYDYANYHAYDSGNTNIKLFPGYTYDWNKQNTIMESMRHGKPWIVTETGYENAINWNRPTDPNYQQSSYHYISELAAGKYYSVLFMEMFKRGAQKIYTYEFIDQNTSDQLHSENNFGLIHTDGSEKPAYTAIKNTISILNDNTAVFTPAELTYTLSGDTTGMRNSLYQKSNGRYYLALWQGKTQGVCYDFLNFTDIPSHNQSITVTLPFVASQINVYQPLTSGSAISTGNNQNTVTVNVPDNLILVEVVPAGSPQQQNNVPKQKIKTQ
jgi:hypothetical protein